VEASALHAPTGLSRASAAGPLLRFRSDDQLVALFRMGYEDAFRVIHDRYRQRLFAYTRQMLGGSRSDAEDALQEVFLRAYNALRRDDRPVTLRAWLYRVAHNRCIDQLRRPLPAPADLFETSRAPLQDPMTTAERREDLRRLVEDVGRLPEQQRSALLMRELEGLSYAELADALDVSVPAIKSLLVRARIGLTEAIDARDTACVEIRADLAGTHERGVRLSGRSRRHLRDCAGCRDYQQALRRIRTGFGALNPGGGPLATLAKLLGIGGASSGAAAGGSVAAGAGAASGGGAAVVGGGAAAAKVAAIVCCAAVVGGGAAEVSREIQAPSRPRVHHVAAPSAAPVRAPVLLRHTTAAASSAPALPAPPSRTAGGAPGAAVQPAAGAGNAPAATAALPADGSTAAPTADELRTGGVRAPDETGPAAGPSVTAVTGQPAPAGNGATSQQPPVGGTTGSSPSESTQSGSGQTASGPSGTVTPDGSATVAQGAAADSPPDP
jgi:RNA polymerase sigma factor (sigma-70 family)